MLKLLFSFFPLLSLHSSIYLSVPSFYWRLISVECLTIHYDSSYFQINVCKWTEPIAQKCFPSAHENFFFLLAMNIIQMGGVGVVLECRTVMGPGWLCFSLGWPVVCLQWKFCFFPWGSPKLLGKLLCLSPSVYSESLLRENSHTAKQ